MTAVRIVWLCVSCLAFGMAITIIVQLALIRRGQRRWEKEREKRKEEHHAEG